MHTMHTAISSLMGPISAGNGKATVCLGKCHQPEIEHVYLPGMTATSRHMYMHLSASVSYRHSHTSVCFSHVKP